MMIHHFAEVTEVDFETLEPLAPPIWRCAWPCGQEFPDELKALAHVHDRAELVGCEKGDEHIPTSNEFLDAWCLKCGERLLLTGFAGGPDVRS